MACMKLGSKPDVFHLDGQSWFCSTGLPSDVVVEVGDTFFHLHKFPLLSRSGLLEALIASEFGGAGEKCSLKLRDVPGGAKAFLLVAKFCYGVRIELDASNAAPVRCAAEYLRMTEDYGEGNLAAQVERLLDEVFAGWADSLRALEACREVTPYAEDLHVVPRCLSSLAAKACAADPAALDLPVSESPEGVGSAAMFWNGISAAAKPGPAVPGGEEWWFDDVSSLSLPHYKRLILAVESWGMRPEKISASLMHYARKNLSWSAAEEEEEESSSVFSSPHDAEQRNLLEEIAGLIPPMKGATPTEFLLRLLRTAMALRCSPACRELLEEQVGAQLDRAALEDLLMPSLEYTTDTLYDVDCVHRILDHFMAADKDDDGQIVGGGALTPITMVASLMDSFLAEVAPDPNLKLQKFLSLAKVIPEYARPLDDGIYRAIDIYLKAHQWLTDSEREQICRVMNCQKLSLEASTHAAQNERLPLRVIVQVLFFEQLRLRTSVAGWFFVSDSLDTLQSHNSTSLALAPPGPRGQIVAVDGMRDRVSVLEKECLGMKEELEKMVKTKGSWNMFLRRIGFRLKSKSCDFKPPKTCNKLVNGSNDNIPESGQV